MNTITQYMTPAQILGELESRLSHPREMERNLATDEITINYQLRITSTELDNIREVLAEGYKGVPV